MSTVAISSPIHREPELLGQTVVVIGGSAGMGLETARRARAEGADVILTARDPDRLQRVGLELGARVTAFDATDFQRLGKFFDELPRPIDHVLVTGPGPYYAPLAQFDFDAARRDLEAHILLPLQIARNAADKVRPGGTLLFIGGTGARHPAVGMALVSALTGGSCHDKEPGARTGARPSKSDRSRIRRHTAVSGSPRRQTERATRAPPQDAADPTRRRPGRRRRTGRPPHDQHGGHRGDLRHRRRSAARGRLSPSCGGQYSSRAPT